MCMCCLLYTSNINIMLIFHSTNKDFQVIFTMQYSIFKIIGKILGIYKTNNKTIFKNFFWNLKPDYYRPNINSDGNEIFQGKTAFLWDNLKVTLS